jgi:hypothetical protein
MGDWVRRFLIHPLALCATLQQRGKQLGVLFVCAFLTTLVLFTLIAAAVFLATLSVFTLLFPLNAAGFITTHPIFELIATALLTFGFAVNALFPDSRNAVDFLLAQHVLKLSLLFGASFIFLQLVNFIQGIATCIL